MAGSCGCRRTHGHGVTNTQHPFPRHAGGARPQPSWGAGGAQQWPGSGREGVAACPAAGEPSLVSGVTRGGTWPRTRGATTERAWCSRMAVCRRTRPTAHRALDRTEVTALGSHPASVVGHTPTERAHSLEQRASFPGALLENGVNKSLPFVGLS